MLDNFIGSVLFEIIGASIKWVFSAIINYIKGKRVPSFKEVYDGKKGMDKADTIFYGVSNILLGIIFTVVLILFLIHLDYRYF